MQAEEDVVIEKTKTPWISTVQPWLIVVGTFGTVAGAYFGWKALPPSLLPSSSPLAPTIQQIDNPTLPAFQGTANIGYNHIALYSCILASAQITCYFTDTLSTGEAQYDIHGFPFPQNIHLIDEKHIEHDLIQPSWIDGNGTLTPTLWIGPNQPTWFVLTFKNNNSSPTEATVVFNGTTVTGSISSP